MYRTFAISILPKTIHFGIHSIVCFPFIFDFFFIFHFHFDSFSIFVHTIFYKQWNSFLFLSLVIVLFDCSLTLLSHTHIHKYILKLTYTRLYTPQQKKALISAPRSRFSIDLIWFIRFTSGFDIPERDTIYLATLNIFSMENNVQMVEENAVMLLSDDMYYLNEAQRFTVTIVLFSCICYFRDSISRFNRVPSQYLNWLPNFLHFQVCHLPYLYTHKHTKTWTK